MQKLYQVRCLDEKRFPGKCVEFKVAANGPEGVEEFLEALRRTNQAGFSIEVTSVVESIH